ncbi:hypothetical protein [Lichenibacterium ramalinae]|uniref:hypothetical protein n=1 Tax=Lichenibacterium ramalinae TaxID=2316527 RepID=UPI00100DD4D0|nr:hypothetical protein [Lichenibacterium ramalinae]
MSGNNAMSSSDRVKRKKSSTQATAAASAARRRNKGLRRPHDDVETFVLRRSPGQKSYLWQIRLFGGVVLLTSDDDYPSLESAREAGIAAKANYRHDAGRMTPSAATRQSAGPADTGRRCDGERAAPQGAGSTDQGRGARSVDIDEATRALSPSANSLQLRTESSSVGSASPRRPGESRSCSSRRHVADGSARLCS